ncbi:MAG: hypothetical protein KF884_10760 [Fimbriimonadaceae bacterium]|nr:hypothetical protein [Fimbriimonadaceae bacterium]QYK58027.1 MAG: hypothetical protein KF884_10760 [Fimbriimonadaceae bacterium]
MTAEALGELVEKGFRARLCGDRLDVWGPVEVLDEARPFAKDIKRFLSMARSRRWPEGLQAWLALIEWSLELDGSPLAETVKQLRSATDLSRKAYEDVHATLRADPRTMRLVSDLVDRHRSLTGLELYSAIKKTFSKRPAGAEGAFD